MANVTAEARATARYLPVSATKIRPVLALIRGRGVEDAERELQLCQRSAADHVFKLLESAIANAEHTRELPPEELFVVECYADEGPTRRWGRPRARGRYGRIKKRSSHVTIALARYSPEELELVRARDEARGGTSAESRRRRAERVARSRAAKAPAQEIDEDIEDVEEVEELDELADVEAVDEVEAEDEVLDEADEDAVAAEDDVEAEDADEPDDEGSGDDENDEKDA
jgi:large subunit ribosomal protein L22